MELLYFWIDKYKSLSDIGINLSNGYQFDYSKTGNTLRVTEVENYIPNFFQENISNLTGLIGVNSTGKTSILRYILEFFSDGINGNEEKVWLAIYKHDDDFHYYYHKNDLQILPSNVATNFLRVSDLNILKDKKTTIYLSTHFEPTSIYSNDYTRNQYGATKNLSTYYLLHSDIQERTGHDANNRNLTFDDRLSAFAALEFTRIVRTLRWLTKMEQRNPFPFELPPYLNITSYTIVDSPNKSKFDYLQNVLDNFFNIKRSNKQLFLLKAFQASIFHFIDEERFVVGSDEIKEQYSKIYQYIIDYLEKKRQPTVMNKGASIIHELNDIFYGIISRFHSFNTKLSIIQAYLENLNDFLKIQQATVSRNGNVLSIKLDKVILYALQDFIELYYKSERIGTFSEFYLSHEPGEETSLSSGEYAILSIFSRLNTIKIHKKQDLLLLIDEAELALHPQWQKQFISLFINFVSERFSSHNTQIVLTSHSPFILSDLPPHCVILLQKDGNATKVTQGLQSKKETFGANIHELFTDSFFLQDGLMGEFARTTIEKLIASIDSEKTEINMELFTKKYKRQVNIIGEQFLRTKILELIASKADLEVIDYLIDARKNEFHILNELRKVKHDKDRMR